MDFKLAVTGRVTDDDVDQEVLKEAMSEAVHSALMGLKVIEPGAMYIQFGEGQRVNIINRSAETFVPPQFLSVPVPPMPTMDPEQDWLESDCDCVDHSNGCQARTRRAGRWED